MNRPGRLVVALTVLALLATGCRTLGPGLPICGELAITDDGERISVTDEDGVTVSLRAAHLLQLQAVPAAEHGVCLTSLPTGWHVSVDEPRSGAFGIGVSAEAFGGRFLDVQLLEGCAPDERANRVRTRSGADRWSSVEGSTTVAVTVVPAAERHRRDGWDVAVRLIGRQVRGSALRVTVAPVEEGPVETRVAAAQAAGSIVLVVDDRFVDDGRVALHRPGAAMAVEGTLGEALAELAARAPRPRVRATWWDLYDDHCIVHRLDARGDGAQGARPQVEAVLDTFPLGELREQLRTLGHEVAR